MNTLQESGVTESQLADAYPSSAASGALLEQHIRPIAMMRDKQACIACDRDFLLARRDRFVRVPCPACGENDPREAFTKHGFAYQRCRKCETLLMNPRADQTLMNEFYASSRNYAYWNEHVFPATENVRRERIFKPRVDRLLGICEKFGRPAQSLLDVGAGFGTFATEVATRRVFRRVVALEPTPSLANTCRKRGLETIESTVEQCPLDDETFDVITAFEVIEHLFDPAHFVHCAKRLLRPEGLLILSCPNVNGFDVSTLGRRSNTIDHEHVNYFHPDSIRLLLERVGFEVLDVSTPGKLDAELVRTAAMDGRIWLDDQPLLKRLLIDDWDDLGQPFQEFIAQHGLSSHMWACARKTGK